MSAQDPFLAEICLFPFAFAPKGWALCNGQLLPIRQFTALFSLLGTTYGGDGKSTFALPNLQGMAVMGPGQGQGLSQHFLGETSGEEAVSLLESELPAHIHTVVAQGGGATSASPAAAAPATSETELYDLIVSARQPLTPTGQGQAHSNMQPYLTLNYCISLSGLFPARG